MREIKFRAWDSETEEMYYTGESFDIIFYFDSEGIVAERVTEDGTEKLEHLEYMAYTGLKDKKCKKIYEGDIVNVNHYGGTPKYETVRFYTNAGFTGIHPFTDSGHHWASHRCEIVGNIYENPELLEGEK